MNLTNNSAAGRERVLWLAGVAAWLVVIVVVGLPQAFERHFQVDEIQVAYNIALWGVHGAPEASNYAAPYMTPLAHLIAGQDSTTAILLTLRLCFFLVFLGSLIVIARAQPFFRGRWPRLGVLFAATLFHPLWHHGFEIRHDALLAAGSIALYALAIRVAKSSATTVRPALIAAGCIAAMMQACSLKALLFWPVELGLVWFAATQWRSEQDRPRMLATLLWLAGGFVVGAGISLGVLVVDGKFDLYVGLVRYWLSNSATGYTFGPTPALLDLALGAPVVFAPAVAYVGLFVIRAKTRRDALGSTDAVTVGFFVWSLIALYLNPAPFSYNLVYVAPFAFLAALGLLAALRIDDLTTRRLAIATLAAASAMSLGRDFRLNPYARTTNTAQLAYASAAESLTSPDDQVFDGAGLVISRPPAGPDWMLHSLFLKDYAAGKRESVARIISDRPVPVLITNYRWGWLSREDLAMRKARYVQVAPNMYVLGAQLRGSESAVTIAVSGRYLVRPLGPGSQPLQLSGRVIPADGIVDLVAGSHAVAGQPEAGALIHWLGPTATALPSLPPPNNGGRLFIND